VTEQLSRKNPGVGAEDIVLLMYDADAFNDISSCVQFGKSLVFSFRLLDEHTAAFVRLWL